jgi:hypothetical protein
MKVKILNHGVVWFFNGIEDGEDNCPDCDNELTIPDDCELPYLNNRKVYLKCQCSECGCVYILERTLKEIKEANDETDD